MHILLRSLLHVLLKSRKCDRWTPLILYFCGSSTIVATHGSGLYVCGYAWEWSLLVWLRMRTVSFLLWIHMGMVSTIVATHRNALNTIVDTHEDGLY